MQVMVPYDSFLLFSCPFHYQLQFMLSTMQSVQFLSQVTFTQNTMILIPKDPYHLHATNQFMPIISINQFIPITFIYPFIPIIFIYQLGHVNTCHHDPSPRGSITFNTFFSNHASHVLSLCLPQAPVISHIYHICNLITYTFQLHSVAHSVHDSR
jgi:hypothetical protein